MEMAALGLNQEGQAGLLYLAIGREEPAPQTGGQGEHKSRLGKGKGLCL